MTDDRSSVLLLVDDNPQNLQVLAGMLEPDGHELVLAMSGREALDAVEAAPPDLILLDVMMPDMDGFEVCRQLRMNPRHADIPVIFLTARTEVEDIVKGFQAGGVDYLFKPFSPMELQMRLNTHLSLKRSRDDLVRFNHALAESNARFALANRELERVNLQLEKANGEIHAKNTLMEALLDRLRIASTTDPLTGLWNRRFLITRLEEEEARFRRYGRPYAIIIGDIDHFKGINDLHGHDCGDQVLTALAESMREGLREHDLLSRWGGEEFLMLLPETDLSGAMAIAERIRRMIEQLRLQYEGISLEVRMTFGVSDSVGASGTNAVILMADHALYAGKDAGRNQVMCASAHPACVHPSSDLHRCP